MKKKREKLRMSKQLSYQARRHVIKSGPAEVRARAEGTSGGEHERGYPPSCKGGLGGSPPRKFLIYGCLYVRF